MQIEQTKARLSQCRKHHQDLLCTIVPKHIASMLLSGIPTYSFCEVQSMRYRKSFVLFIFLDSSSDYGHVCPHSGFRTIN